MSAPDTDPRAHSLAVWRVLEQNKVWTDTSGTTWQLDDMTTSHLRNLRKWLMDRAVVLAFYHGLGLAHAVGRARGEVARWDSEKMMEQEWKEQIEDPEGWLAAKPLVQRIEEILRERGHAGE